MITNAEIKKRIELEERIVRQLIRSLKTADWNVLEVDDGGDSPVKVKTEEEAVDAIFAAHDSYVYFIKPQKNDSKRMMEHWVRLVPGNGEDIISDFNFSEKEGDDFLETINLFEDGLTQTNDSL